MAKMEKYLSSRHFPSRNRTVWTYEHDYDQSGVTQYLSSISIKGKQVDLLMEIRLASTVNHNIFAEMSLLIMTMFNQS